MNTIREDLKLATRKLDHKYNTGLNKGPSAYHNWTMYNRLLGFLWKLLQ
jgi:hypothetical protein